jgi:hypothetical protein
LLSLAFLTNAFTTEQWERHAQFTLTSNRLLLLLERPTLFNHLHGHFVTSEQFMSSLTLPDDLSQPVLQIQNQQNQMQNEQNGEELSLDEKDADPLLQEPRARNVSSQSSAPVTHRIQARVYV